jgi:Fe2+ transport system protein FeoA
MRTAPLSSFAARHGMLEIVEVHDTDANKRLVELGVCPGRHIRVVRRGNPAILSLGESRFALSIELLNLVLARPLD